MSSENYIFNEELNSQSYMLMLLVISIIVFLKCSVLCNNKRENKKEPL